MSKLGVILLFLLTTVCAKAQDYRSFTLWNKNEFSVKSWENITLSVSDRTQYIPKRNTFAVALGQLAVEHELKKWLEYGAAMRISYLNRQNGNWVSENRPMAFVTLSKESKEFELSFSNRIEYRSYKELEDHFRHKQTLKLDFPPLAEWGMHFYVSEESFYKMNGGGTHLARFQSGITALEKEWFAMKVYYILEKAKLMDTWFTGDILGLNLSFDI